MDYTLINDGDEFDSICDQGKYKHIHGDTTTYKIITLPEEGVHNTYVYSLYDCHVGTFIKLTTDVNENKYTVSISIYPWANAITIGKNTKMVAHIRNPINTSNLEIQTFDDMGDEYDYYPDVLPDIRGRLSQCDFTNICIDEIIQYFNEIHEIFHVGRENLRPSQAERDLVIFSTMYDILQCTGNHQELGSILRTIFNQSIESNTLSLPMVII